jgi:SAM-dependent methyltransferase
LQLLAGGQRRIARLCLQDWRGGQGGVRRREFVSLTRQDSPRRYLSNQLERLVQRLPAFTHGPYRSTRKWLGQRLVSHEGVPSSGPGGQSRAKFLESLRKRVDAIRFKVELNWDYYDGYYQFPSFTNTQEWSRKNFQVAEILQQLQPGTVLDIGSNRGWYSLLAARQGADVAALDTYEPVVSQLYRDAQQHTLAVQPLVLDFLWPSPGSGLFGFSLPAESRLKSDITLALALVHHLVHKQGLGFDHFVSGLSEFSRRWLLVEFVQYGDRSLAQWCDSERDWYSRDNFLAALEQRFQVVGVAESDPPTRTLILCEKIRQSKA